MSQAIEAQYTTSLGGNLRGVGVKAKELLK
jgi:hypothetical protein